MNPALEFLLKRKGPVGLIPFVRALQGSVELAVEFAEAGARGDFIIQGGGQAPGDAVTGTAFFSPEIQKYESSALGSSRII